MNSLRLFTFLMIVAIGSLYNGYYTNCYGFGESDQRSHVQAKVIACMDRGIQDPHVIVSA